MKTELSDKQLQEAVAQGLLTQEQAKGLWSFLIQSNGVHTTEEKLDTPVSKFFYYLGALIVIGAMGWFMNNTWEQFGGYGLFSIAAAYAACFILVGVYFRNRSVTLSGLLLIMAVCMTPLAMYGLQKGLGIWPHGYPGTFRSFHIYVKSGWFMIEIATLAAGLLALRYVQIPFVMAPIAFTLWYMSMDITPVLYGSVYTGTARKIVSIFFGMAMLAGAFVVDRRTKIDYAKWVYIFGSIAFWTGLTLLDSHSELGKFLYCLLNAFFILLGILLERRVFTIFGALGVFGYIGHLAWSVFRDSLLFPFALTGVGLLLIYLGWFYHTHQEQILRYVHLLIPQWILRKLPQHRGSI